MRIFLRFKGWSFVRCKEAINSALVSGACTRVSGRGCGSCTRGCSSTIFWRFSEVCSSAIVGRVSGGWSSSAGSVWWNSDLWTDPTGGLPLLGTDLPGASLLGWESDFGTAALWGDFLGEVLWGDLFRVFLLSCDLILILATFPLTGLPLVFFSFFCWCFSEFSETTAAWLGRIYKRKYAVQLTANLKFAA